MPPIRFEAPVQYRVPIGPGAIETADLDGDGHLDLLVINGPNLSLLYGRGDGTFEPAVTMRLGQELYHAIPLDADQDGRPDIAVCDDRLSELFLLHNDGNRHFHLAATYPTGTKPYGVTTADFNEDGWPDLAVSNDGATDGKNGMCVLLNRGDGTFAAPVFYDGGEYPARVAAADLDCDGHIDLALSNYVSADVYLFHGTGTGSFVPSGRLAVEAYPAQVLVDDFNGDGIPDLATADTFADTVSVLFGLGGGHFQDAVGYPTATYPHIMKSVDLDGDGAPDLAVPHNGSGVFSVLRNLGDGTFAPPVYYRTGGFDVRYAATGDFNEDGRPDVVLANGGSQSVSVLLNATTTVALPIPAPRVEALLPAEIDLAWELRSPERASTRIERSASGNAFVTLSITPPGVTRFPDITAQAGIPYRYLLRSETPFRTSAPSAPVAATIPIGGRLATTPHALVFRPGLLGTGSRRDLLIRNTGTGPLAVTVDPPPPPYRETPSGTIHWIGPRNNERVTVRLPSTAADAPRAALSVRSSDPASPLLQIPLIPPGSP